MIDVRGDFKRSTRFGIIGVFVVMSVSAVIALAFGSGANPTGALIAILAIVFGYVAVLMTLQRRDVDRAEAKGERSASSPTGPVDDPTTVDTDALLVALAIKPIDQAALASARTGTFGMVRSSINSGAVIMVLIFFAVVPWILFQFIWSIILFAPIIAAYAIYLAVHTIGAGGRLDQAYDASAATLEPLGLTLTERPKVEIRDRFGSPTPQADVVGAVAFEGRRHGRAVAIRLEGAGATTVLAER